MVIPLFENATGQIYRVLERHRDDTLTPLDESQNCSSRQGMAGRCDAGFGMGSPLAGGGGRYPCISRLSESNEILNERRRQKTEDRRQKMADSYLSSVIGHPSSRFHPRELVVAVGIMAMVILFAGVIFKQSIGSYRRRRPRPRLCGNCGSSRNS